MKSYFSLPAVAALLAGVVTGGTAAFFTLTNAGYAPHLPFLGGNHSEEFHIHADLLIIDNGTEVELSDDTFMSVLERILHPGVHLHDNNGHVIHFHAPNVRLVEFFASLGITLTPECFTKDNAPSCADTTTLLKLFVNGEDRTDTLTTYVPADEDRILLYIGSEDDLNLPTLLDRITNDACLYSGTCPERGTPPPESCGLTCVL